MGEAMRATAPEDEPTDPGMAGFGAPAKKNGEWDAVEAERTNSTVVPGHIEAMFHKDASVRSMAYSPITNARARWIGCVS